MRASISEEKKSDALNKSKPDLEQKNGYCGVQRRSVAVYLRMFFGRQKAEVVQGAKIGLRRCRVIGSGGRGCSPECKVP